MVRLEIRVAGQNVVVETHDQPDLDEIAAMFLAMKYGDTEFLDEYGWNGQQYCLKLGVGGGAFDEHPSGNQPRREDECCATLMARVLGIRHWRALRSILEYVLRADLWGSRQNQDLATGIKNINQMCPDQPVIAINWGLTALEALYQEGENLTPPDFRIPRIFEFIEYFEGTEEAETWYTTFWNAQRWAKEQLSLADQEFENKGQWEKIQTPSGPVWVASIKSDNTQMNRLVRRKYGGQNRLVIVQTRSSGNVQVFTNGGLDLILVAAFLRRAEQITRGWDEAAFPKQLYAEGSLAGWYFHPGKSSHSLLNGSLKHSAPPTQLTLTDIAYLVREGLKRTL